MPLVTVSCLLYATFRHGVDSLNLITVFRREIDSQGLLIDSVTKTAFMLIIAYQFGMMAFFYIKQYQDEALACLIVFVASIAYIVLQFDQINDFERPP